MSLKKLLVHVDHLETGERRLRAAASVAQQFGAAVNALYVDSWVLWASASVYGPEITPALIENQKAVSESQRSRAKEQFDRVAAGVRGPMMWLVNEGDVAGRICANAHVNDLVVLGGVSSEYSGLLDQVVLGAGRPVLLLPDRLLSMSEPVFDFQRIVVGWNASRESARAIQDALPFLHRADTVTVVTVTFETEAGESPESMSLLLQYLDAHGIAAQTEVIGHGQSGNSGEILLETAAAKNAGLLVMGAYGHSRWREIVLGGSTRHVLKHAQLPVLMSH